MERCRRLRLAGKGVIEAKGRKSPLTAHANVQRLLSLSCGGEHSLQRYTTVVYIVYSCSLVQSTGNIEPTVYNIAFVFPLLQCLWGASVRMLCLLVSSTMTWHCIVCCLYSLQQYDAVYLSFFCDHRACISLLQDEQSARTRGVGCAGCPRVSQKTV